MKKQQDHKHHFKLSFIIIAATIGLITILTLLNRLTNNTAGREIILPVSIIKPQSGSLVKEYRVSGYIESVSVVTVLPKISGTLLSLPVETAQPVEKGMVIGEIDPAVFLLNLKQAEATYLSARSQYERISKLYREKGVSQQNFEDAKYGFDAAESTYELAGLNYEYTRIKSPVDGVILKKHAVAGELVSPQVPIVTIGDLQNLVVKTRVPEN